MSSKKEWARGSLVLRSAICAPAGRLVVIEAWAWGTNDAGSESGMGCNYRVLPVVAIARDYVAHYRHTNPQRYLNAATHEHAVEQGWVFVGEDDEYEPVVFGSCDGDYPACFPMSRLEVDNGVLSLALCSWPDSDDQERLKPAVRNALVRLQRKLSMRGDPKPSPAVFEAISQRIAEVLANGVRSDDLADFEEFPE